MEEQIRDDEDSRKFWDSLDAAKKEADEARQKKVGAKAAASALGQRRRCPASKHRNSPARLRLSQLPPHAQMQAFHEFAMKKEQERKANADA